jgi:hypothetical protein
MMGHKAEGGSPLHGSNRNDRPDRGGRAVTTTDAPGTASVRPGAPAAPRPMDQVERLHRICHRRSSPDRRPRGLSQDRGSFPAPHTRGPWIRRTSVIRPEASEVTAPEYKRFRHATLSLRWSVSNNICLRSARPASVSDRAGVRVWSSRPNRVGRDSGDAREGERSHSIRGAA